MQEQRVVGNDWCVRWRNRIVQIQAEHASLKLPGKRVRVKQLADGRLLVEHQQCKLSIQESGSAPAPAKKIKKPIVNNRRYKPSGDHPWNAKPAVGPRPAIKPAPATPARALRLEQRKAG